MEQDKKMKTGYIIKTDKNSGYLYDTFICIFVLLLAFIIYLYRNNINQNPQSLIVLSLVMVVSGIILLIRVIYSFKNDQFCITDGKVYAHQGINKYSFSVDQIYKIANSINMGQYGLYSQDKDSIGYNIELFGLQRRYYTQESIHKTLQKLKELKPDIVFDEESQKILDGEFK